MHEQIQKRIEQIPGVTAVGLASGVTMVGSNSGDPVFAEDFPGPAGRIPPIRRYKYVGANYFETMGNPGDRWPRVDVGRQLRTPSGRRDQREPGAGVLEGSRGGAWAPRAEQSEQPVAHHRPVSVGNERDNGGPPSLRRPPFIGPPLIANYWIDELRVQRTLAYAIAAGRPHVGDVDQGGAAGGVVGESESCRSRACARSIRSARRRWRRRRFALVMPSASRRQRGACCSGVVGIYGVISYMATQRTPCEIGIRIGRLGRRGERRQPLVPAPGGRHRGSAGIARPDSMVAGARRRG
jgi:hypothetical protein